MALDKLKVSYRINYQQILLGFAVLAFGTILQLLLLKRDLNNGISSFMNPTAVDAHDYVSRAMKFLSNGFDAAFSDGQRMPGYPLFLSFVYVLSGDNHLLITKIIQIALYSFSGLLVQRTLMMYVNQYLSTSFACLLLIIPIWRFSTTLIAENLTFFLACLLVYILAKQTRFWSKRRFPLLLGLVLSSLVYTKPNNVILLFVVIVIIFVVGGKFKYQSILICLVTFLITLSPWSIYISKQYSGFVGLSTNVAANLYVGTGMRVSYDDGVLSLKARNLGIDPKNNERFIYDFTKSQNIADKNRELMSISLQIWKTRPIKQILFGLTKVLYAFGISADSQTGQLLGISLVFTCILAFVNRKKVTLRPWVFGLFVLATLLAIQAFVFQADRRFVVPLLSPFIVIIWCLSVSTFFSSRKIN